MEIQNQGTAAISTGIEWGNVIINNTTTAQAIGNAAAFANVDGDFTVRSTNNQEYRLMSNQPLSHKWQGNLTIESGILV